MIYVVAGQALVVCAYCSIEMKKTFFFKGHTENKHGKNVPVKENLSPDQSVLSGPKITRTDSEKPIIEEEKNEEKAQEDMKEETKEEIKQQQSYAKKEILTAITNWKEKKVSDETKNDTDIDIINNTSNVKSVLEIFPELKTWH